MFLKFYIFLTFIWSGYAKIVADYNGTEKFLIIGGYVPKEHTLARFTVSIADHPSGPLGPLMFGMGHFCAGAIIGSRSILTSATCVRDKKPEDILVVAGTPNRIQKVSTTGIFIVVSININPDFVPGEIPQNNIAIVRVNRFIVTDNKNVERADLPPDGPPKENDECTLVGWGRPRIDEYNLNELRYTDLVILGKDKCEEWHPLTTTTFCAGYPDYRKHPNPLLSDYNGTEQFVLGGGYIPKNHKFAKYTVAIGDASPNGSLSFCAGVIIGPETVLTSATCVNNKKPIDIVITAGTHILTKKFKSTRRLVGKSIKVHPGFVPGEIPKNNLAIIHMHQKLTLDYEAISQVRLAASKSLEVYNKCVLVGWGKPKGNESFPYELRYVDLFVRYNSRCAELLPLAPKTFCAGKLENERPRSACLDDEGGPLFCPKDPYFVLYGIVNLIYNCSVIGNTYFTDIYEHYNWIKQNADDDIIYFRSSAQRLIINSTLLKNSIIFFIFVNFLF